MKTCNSCKILKDLSQFYKNKTTKDGLHRKCKDCSYKQRNQYYRINKNKPKNQKRVGIINNLLGKRFGMIVVIERVGSSIRENGQLGYAKWKYKCDCGVEKIASAKTIKKAKSCGCINGSIKLRNPDVNLNTLYRTYISNAKRRNREFTLTKEQFKELISKDCFYCGIEPKQIYRTTRSNSDEYRESSKLIYNGIDRVDNNIGYILNNCVPCCGHCNRMKLEYTQQEFFSQIKKICDNHIAYKPDKTPQQKAEEAYEQIQRTQELNEKLKELGVSLFSKKELEI